MYAFIDRPVESLGQGSRFILWAMRAWHHATSKQCCLPGILAPGFARMGLLGALTDLHMTMVYLQREGLEPFIPAPIDHDRITEDEAVMLAVWRNISRGAMDSVQATLDLLVEDSSVSPVMLAMTRTATRLAAVGIAPVGMEAAAAKEAE